LTELIQAWPALENKIKEAIMKLVV
jgi:hypothetical protein